MSQSDRVKRSWEKRRPKHQAKEIERRKAIRLAHDGGSHKPSLPRIKWLERPDV